MVLNLAKSTTLATTQEWGENSIETDVSVIIYCNIAV